MRKAVNPYVALAFAIALPGGGHVILGDIRRGICFALFVLMFSMLTYLTTTPDHSFIGRYAGGLFVWALSIPEAYRRARLRATWSDGTGTSAVK